MSSSVLIAAMTNAATLLALLVTQFNSQRNEGRRLREARVARLSAARREVYLALLKRCDEIGRLVERKQREYDGRPAPADLYPEDEGVIQSVLLEPLCEVDLMGDAATSAAARDLASVVSDYGYTEDAALASRVNAARSAFIKAARQDLDTN